MTKTSLDMEENIEVAGEVYTLNDHVYLSAPWNISDGAPWLIGRIMEFIREPGPSSSTPISASSHSTNKKKRKSSIKLPPIIQVKIAHYHRQRDLMSRHILDSRLLSASMTYDVFSINRLRGKCRVDYKPPGEDLDALKNSHDRFYFHQVYGRYTHRHYDLIPTENVKNAPPEVVQYLRSHYSYVFAEADMGPQLGDERRGCVSCQKWTTGADSVTCAICSRAYHFACLDPPLTRKPERGYTWACAPCSKQRQDKIEDNVCKGLDAPPSSVLATGRTLRDKGKKKEAPPTTVIQTEGEASGALRTLDGWPFRYYGQYTDPASIMDPFDCPFLYTAPRLGPRFQTNVPDDPSEKFVPFFIPANRLGRPCKGEKRARDGTLANVQSSAAEVEVTRGGDETITITSTPEQFINDIESTTPLTSSGINTLDEYLARVRALPSYKSVGVTLLDRALALQREAASYEEAFEKVAGLCVKSLGFTTWNETESHRMDAAIQDLGEDLRGMVKHFPKKTCSNIAQFYYMFKGHKYPEPSAHDSRIAASSSQLPDESATILPTPTSKRPYLCVVCETRASATWRKCPEALMAGATLGKKAICDECHSRWRRYGLHTAPSGQQEDAKPKEGRTKRPYNRQPKVVPTVQDSSFANSPSASLPTPPPIPPPEFPPLLLSAHSQVVSQACVLCQQTEPHAELAQCGNCTLACHRACGGLESNGDLQNWLCLLCRTVGSKTLPKIPSCSLCFGAPAINTGSETMTALDLWKVTEYNTFVHLLCASWHPELVFSEPLTFEKVEGFTTIPSSKRGRDCAICKKSSVGACSKCDVCNKYIHVSCAWTAGYKFGLEMLPPKRKRGRAFDSVKFRGSEGFLEPKIWCQEHFPGAEKVTYNLADRDHETNFTALQTYVNKFRTTGQAPNVAILRKARRLDAVLESVLSPKLSVPSDIAGKGLDLEDSYMGAALSGLPQKLTTIPKPVTVPTPVILQPQSPAVTPQGSLTESRTSDSVPRGGSRCKGRGGRTRGKSKGSTRVRGVPHTIVVSQEPTTDLTGGAVDNIDERNEAKDEEVQGGSSSHSYQCAVVQEDITKNSNAANVTINNPVVASQPSFYPSMPSVAPVASSSRLEPTNLIVPKSETVRESERSPINPVISSFHVANLGVPSPEPYNLQHQVPLGDTQSRKQTVIKPEQNESKIPSAGIVTPNLPKRTNKLRLTLKPAAPQPASCGMPAVAPEPLPKERAQNSLHPAFPHMPTSTAPTHLSHPPRPISSGSSSSSTSSKPPPARLPSIDSLFPNISRLYHLSALRAPPPVSLPPTTSAVMNSRVMSPTLQGAPSYDHASPANPSHVTFTSTAVRPMRVAGPLLNPPSFDAFAAAAAAHTTKSASSNTSARTGASVSPASSHKKLDHNPTPLLPNPVHFS